MELAGRPSSRGFTVTRSRTMIVPDMHVIDEVVARWQRLRSGCALRYVYFPAAQASECHANAAAYAAQHGGDVAHGFLLHLRAPWAIHVMAHSVVRLSDHDLIDPTLTDLARTGHAYFEHIGSAEMFLKNTKAWAEVPVMIDKVPDTFWQHHLIAPDGEAQ